MTRARLRTGEVVTLEKDCECISHEGPHWLFLLDWDKETISKMLTEGQYYRHITESILYLARKEIALTSRGIEEILRP